jgi:acetoin utilization deacetylase AcuC-like enzyme
LRAADRFGANALVVALGFDVYKDDPQSRVGVTTEGFARLGAMVKEFARPTVICQEGGYHLDTLNANAQAFFGAIDREV